MAKYFFLLRRNSLLPIPLIHDPEVTDTRIAVFSFFLLRPNSPQSIQILSLGERNLLA
jgi:hypothetical protein